MGATSIIMQFDIKSQFGMRYVSRDDYSKKVLELVVTDFCNLSCKLCVQGVPYQDNKKFMSFDDIVHLSQYFKPYEFNMVKISGGEPTIHHDFGRICDNLKRLFPAKSYALATNGILLHKYIEQTRFFSLIDLTHYLGENDAVCQQLREMSFPNLKYHARSESSGLVDVFEEKNLNKNNVFETCSYYFPPRINKVVQDRIYPCCNIFGLSVLRGVGDPDKISVRVDKDWRENLSKLDIESYCKRCFYDVIHPDDWFNNSGWDI